MLTSNTEASSCLKTYISQFNGSRTKLRRENSLKMTKEASKKIERIFLGVKMLREASQKVPSQKFSLHHLGREDSLVIVIEADIAEVSIAEVFIASSWA